MKRSRAPAFASIGPSCWRSLPVVILWRRYHDPRILAMFNWRCYSCVSILHERPCLCDELQRLAACDVKEMEAIMADSQWGNHHANSWHAHYEQYGSWF